MDISLLKTFIELSRTRHFGKAAKSLFLTQSAISARLKLLEENLGVKLLTRERNNINLTPAGMRFLKHAESIVNAWNMAVQETALEEENKTLLSIAGVYSLWDIGLQNWLYYVRQTFPDIATQVEAHGQDALLRHLLEGALDLGFIYESPLVRQLEVVELGSVTLKMVSTEASLTSVQALNRPDYVMIDWGTAFTSSHARFFPDMPPPAVRIGPGHLGMSYLLSQGGSAYLAESMCKSRIASGDLFVVADAPVIERKVYAAFAYKSSRGELIESVIASFKTENFFG